MGENEIPDSAPIFEDPPTTEFGKYCVHAAYRVNEQQRTVTCTTCGGALDPFALILRYARGQARVENLDRLLKAKSNRLEELEADEVRTKARTRNANKKDADAAVKALTAKMQRDQERTVWALREARDRVTTALKRLGYKESPRG